MSNAFRELLKKVGSGVHTSQDLTRQEAADATRMMLLQEATPAQIGAFLISHRIKRPTGEELAGMLDAYDQLGQKLQPITEYNLPTSTSPVMVFCCPYDGRDRTSPVTPVTALILAAAGQSVVMHGGDRMPTKYGMPLIEIWQGLGVDFSLLSLAEAQQVFASTGVGFVYLPNHFPLTNVIVSYRDQLGKRPPLATLELIWCPYAGNVHLVSGFVHPPTEHMLREALALRRTTQQLTTVKGLEGSCDLPRDRTAIIGLCQPDFSIERLFLHPRDYGMDGKEVPLDNEGELVARLQNVIQGKPSELIKAAVWNGGFYLWRCGICLSLESGLAEAEALLTRGKVAQKLQEISSQIASFQLAHHL